MADHDLVVLGDCNPDLVLRGNVVPAFGQVEQLLDEALFTIGGSGAIVASGAARLGLRCALISVVGDDALARIQLDALRERGVDVSTVIVDPNLSTGLSVILSRGADRAILTSLGSIDALTAAAVDPAILTSTRHVHVSSYYLQHGLRDTLAPQLKAARDAGASTSLDPNWDPAETWNGALTAILPLIDYLFLNEQEARSISREDDAHAAATKLAVQASTAVVKLGSEGGLVARGSETIRRGAPLVEVADTTGAGDSFDAGFLYGVLAGWELSRCLDLACACGTLSTTATGIDRQPTLREATAATASGNSP